MSKSQKKQAKIDKRVHKYCDDLISAFPNETRAWLELCYIMPATSNI